MLMKLYFSPGAISLSAHIALIEAGLPFDAVRVDLLTKQTAQGSDFLSINPKGHVPALQLESGQILTEVPAVVEYIADQAPGSQLAPPAGSMERYRLMEWLAYIHGEMQPTAGALASSASPPKMVDLARQSLGRHFDFLEKALENRSFLTGNAFTVADSYLFTVLCWCSHFGIDLTRWPTVQAYQERIGDRPAVRTAMTAEGLIAP